MSSISRSRYGFSDEDLRFRVESFLRSRHFPGFERLSVDVSDGSVTLSGQLQSYYEKQVAMNSCRRVAGVVAIIDHVKIYKRRRRGAGILRSENLSQN